MQVQIRETNNKTEKVSRTARKNWGSHKRKRRILDQHPLVLHGMGFALVLGDEHTRDVFAPAWDKPNTRLAK